MRTDCIVNAEKYEKFFQDDGMSHFAFEFNFGFAIKSHKKFLWHLVCKLQIID